MLKHFKYLKVSIFCKSKFGRCLINNNAEVLKGSETVSSRSSTSSSDSNNYFTDSDRPVVPTSKRFKILCKSKKKKKIKLKNMGAPKYHFFFRKKWFFWMRLYEKKQTIGWKKEKKITCFQEKITLQKDREKLSSDLSNIMETKWNVFIYS